MSKQLIFVHLFNDRSGSPKVLSQIVPAMSALGRSVEVLTSSHQDGFLTGLPGQRRQVFYRRSESKLITLFYYLLSQAHLFFSCLRYWPQDVIFYVNTMMPFGAALAAKLMRKPVIYHVHETSIRPALLKKFLRLVIGLTAQKIIFVSDYLLRTEGFAGRAQFVLHNALETTLSTVPQASAGERFNVLMVCSLKKYKGVSEFIRIAQLLVETHIRFTLVLNAEQEEVDAYFMGVELPENVSIFARQSDLSGFYAGASLLLNLSRPDEWVETFGLTILEGMSYGLPVIVPPVGGPAEIVTDGQQGYLISCYETQRIADAIRLISADRTLHAQLAQGARAQAQLFNPADFERKVAEIIDL